jgi:hypothetical protein
MSTGDTYSQLCATTILSCALTSAGWAEDVVPCVNLFSPNQALEVRHEAVNDTIVQNLISEVERRVLLSISISRQIEVRRSEYVATACAARDKQTNKQVLYYNTAWLSTMLGEDKTWALAFAIAHEIGHHLNDHDPNDTLGSYRREYEADRFAGRVIYFLDGDINEAVKIFDTYPYEGSETHPARYIRIQTAIMGFKGDSEEFSGLPRFADLVARPSDPLGGGYNDDVQNNIELLFSDQRDERLLAFSNLRALGSNDPTVLSAMADFALRNTENSDGVYNVLSFLTTQATNEAIAGADPSLKKLLADPGVMDNGIKTKELASVLQQRIAE